MMDGRILAGVAFNAGPVMDGRVSRVGFSASTWAGFMEAFECGTEACSAGRAASGALDSDLGDRAVLPLTCGLFGCMACMSVTQRRQRTAEEPLVGQGGQKRAFHKPMIVH